MTLRSGIVRGLGLSSLVGLAMAVAMGRREAETPARPDEEGRRPWSARPLVLSRYHVAMASPTRAFDPDTLGEIPFATPRDGHLDRAAISPWRGGDGRFEVVGTWQEYAKVGEAGPILQGLELRRIGQPDGALLGRVELRSILTSPPCWLSGPGARVILSGLDGTLSYHDFEAEADGPPRPLAWAPDCPPPHGGRFLAYDPIRIDPATDTADRGDWIVLAIRDRRVGPDPGMALWWLLLESPGTSGSADLPVVRAAGPLFAGGRALKGSESRAPAVISGPGGRGLALVFAERPNPATPWSLRAAPLRFDPEGRGLEIHEDEVETLLEGCLPVSVSTSSDGEDIVAFVPGPGGGRPVRIARGSSGS